MKKILFGFLLIGCSNPLSPNSVVVPNENALTATKDRIYICDPLIPETKFLRSSEGILLTEKCQQAMYDICQDAQPYSSPSINGWDTQASFASGHPYIVYMFKCK